MAKRRSAVRRTGAGRGVTPGVLLALAGAVVALVFIGVQAGRSPGAGEAAMQAGDDSAAIAGRVATGPARAGEGFFQRLGAMWNAAGRVEALEAEKRELEVWRELAGRLAERNARYEALLRMPAEAFGEGGDVDKAIAAQLVLDSGGPFTRTLVANAGADHGVQLGFVAVNENGLIGRVVSVGRRSSRVLMLDDYNSRIPVLGESSRVRAVLAGQATRPPELLPGPFQMQAPRLDFVVGAQNLREGERVLTSGDGGLFPRGIPVGVARHSRDGQWRVALSAAQRPIDFVRLIPFVGVEAPEQTQSAAQTLPPPASSSASVISRAPMAPPPLAPSAPPRRMAPPQSAEPAPATTPTPTGPPQ